MFVLVNAVINMVCARFCGILRQLLSVIYRNVTITIQQVNSFEPSAGLMADDDDTVCTPYQPPSSLWQLIESCTSSHERPEVKRLLGDSLVEQSVELHQEVSSLTLQ